MSNEKQGWGRAEEIAGRLAARGPSIQRGGAGHLAARREEVEMGAESGT